MSEDCPHCVYEKNEANCRGCFEGSHYRPKPVTNADRIRAMTDEELAKYINELSNGECPVVDCPPGLRVNNTCTPWKCWVNWLKQEATE